MTDNIKCIEIVNKMLDEHQVEKVEKLTATLNICYKTSFLLLEKVFNRTYYPLMSEEQYEHVLELVLERILLSCVYPYTKDSSWVRAAQKKLYRDLEDYCVEECLLYLLKDDNDFINMTNYLLETFYNIV